MKKVVFTFGRFSPPTVGHAKLVKKVVDLAKQTGSEPRIYASKSHDNLKNPIPYKDKVGFLRALFPNANVQDDPKAHTAFHITKLLSDEGFDEVIMVVGEDRVSEFEKGISKYVKDRNAKDFDPKKNYGFKSFKVVSAGNRDPNATGVEGMSATKLRDFAKKGDFASFASGTPTKNSQVARKIYNTLRKNMNLNEAVTRKELAPHLHSFVSFASKELGVDSLPNIRFKDESDDYDAFGAYSPHNKEISISTKDRHPVDIFRTLAHELVHHKQNLEGRIKDVAKEGSTGSEIENEANSQAGIIMRNFAKNNPSAFKMKSITEDLQLNEGMNDPSIFKAVFLAGGPGSGKDYILKQTIAGNGMNEINSDVAFEFLMKKRGLDMKMPDDQEKDRDAVRKRAKDITKDKNRLALENRQGLIINGTASDPDKIKQLKNKLEELGYSTMMVYVDTKDEVSRQRNIDRGNNGGRTVPEKIRKDKWNEAAAAKVTLTQVFGEKNFITIDNSTDLRNASIDEIKAKKEEFTKVFKRVRSFSAAPVKNKSAIEWLETEKGKRGVTDLKKTKATSVSDKGHQPAPQQQAPAPTQAPLKQGPSRSIMDKAKSMGLSYYGFGRFGRNHKVSHTEVDGQLKAKKIAESTDINEKFSNFISEEHGAGEEGTPELTKNYMDMTPGQSTNATFEWEFGKNTNVVDWANSKKTKERFEKKYGTLAPEKIAETAKKLEEVFKNNDASPKRKTLKELRSNAHKTSFQ